MPFANRHEAGQRLAEELARRSLDHPVVLGLPRGGVPVAAEVASGLHAPLDVLVVRKLGCPWQPELGMGALGEGDVRVLNDYLIATLGITPAQLESVTDAERSEVERRVRRYRGDRPAVPVRGRTVVLVDDGLATGFTARAGIEVLRQQGAERIVLAVPVAPAETVEEMRAVADEVVCLETPAFFMAIGEWYLDFSQTSDEEVSELLAAHAAVPAGAGVGDPPEAPVSRDVRIPVDSEHLPGSLSLPSRPHGVVVFAHGSGSSRLSPRNVAVARALNDGGFATLLFDLLTPGEAVQRRNVFDVGLLSLRLRQATSWLRREPEAAGLRIGYFGASTGAAAALQAAAEMGSDVGAVVSRGGRPDLAGPHLPMVVAPTLLIVGSRDEVVLELNQRAQQALRCTNRLEVVPGATHLFEEPGALDLVAELARGWFASHLPTTVATA